MAFRADGSGLLFRYRAARNHELMLESVANGYKDGFHYCIIHCLCSQISCIEITVMLVKT